MTFRSQSYPVTPTGVGKKDYSKEISLGQTRPGISLLFNQQITQYVYTPQDQVPTPYPIPWIQPVLAPAGMAHLFDINTGLPLPVAFPAGYAVSVIQESLNFNQDCEIWLYVDGLLIASPILTSSGNEITFSNIYDYSTAVLDPDSLLPHTIDLQIFNRGLANMKGGVNFVILIEQIHTPPWPKDKNTRCPFCTGINKVEIHTTKIQCGHCTKDYFVSDTTMYRGTNMPAQHLPDLKNNK